MAGDASKRDKQRLVVALGFGTCGVDVVVDPKIIAFLYTVKLFEESLVIKIFCHSSAAKLFPLLSLNVVTVLLSFTLNCVADLICIQL